MKIDIMERVIVHHSVTYDFLASIYRLTNNEFLMKFFDSLSTEKEYEPDKRILEWVTETREKLPENITDRMKLFFDWQVPFGMRYLSLIASGECESVEALILYLKGISERDLLRDFLLLGFGPRAVMVDEREINEVMKDEKKFIVFLSKKLALKNEHKAIILEFYSNLTKMKEDLIYLLDWYQENIFRKRIPYVERMIKKDEEEIVINLEKYGEPYLLKLIENMDYSEAAPGRKIVLAISFYMENSMASVFHPLVKKDLFFIGFRYVKLALDNLKKADISKVYRALGDINRLQMLKLIANEKMTGYELSKKMNLSGSEVTACFTVLLDAGLIKTHRTENGLYFSSDLENVKRKVLELLEK